MQAQPVCKSCRSNACSQRRRRSNGAGDRTGAERFSLLRPLQAAPCRFARPRPKIKKRPARPRTRRRLISGHHTTDGGWNPGRDRGRARRLRVDRPRPCMGSKGQGGRRRRYSAECIVLLAICSLDSPSAPAGSIGPAADCHGTKYPLGLGSKSFGHRPRNPDPGRQHIQMSRPHAAAAASTNRATGSRAASSSASRHRPGAGIASLSHLSRLSWSHFLSPAKFKRAPINASPGWQ